MKKTMMACAVALSFAVSAYAEDKAAAAPAAGGAAAMPDMSKFGPMVHQPKKEKEDKKELEAYFKALEDAHKKGDINAVADMMDFPVMMESAGSKGFAKMEMTREAWIGMMKPMMEKMMADMKDVKTTHKGQCFMMDDDLASCEGTMSMSGPKMKGSFNMQSIMVRVDGKWKMKSQLEAGWGDVPAPAGTGGSGAAPAK